MFNNIFSHFNELLSGQILYIIITFQTQHTFFNICSAWKKSFFSSWNHRSLWSAAHSGLAPSLIDHKGSIIIIEQSQPRNHHNSSFSWMLSLPASHIRQMEQIDIFSINSSLPILAHLRHGAMRNCSLRPAKSSYSVVCVWQDYFLWTQYQYKWKSTILLDDMFRTKSYDLSYHFQCKKSRTAAQM